MKLLIDIPEDEYNEWGKNIKNAIPIPDNATVCDIEQIRNEVQRMADSKILNMKIVLDLIDNYTKGDMDV